MSSDVLLGPLQNYLGFAHTYVCRSGLVMSETYAVSTSANGEKIHNATERCILRTTRHMCHLAFQLVVVWRIQERPKSVSKISMSK